MPSRYQQLWPGCAAFLYRPGSFRRIADQDQCQRPGVPRPAQKHVQARSIQNAVIAEKHGPKKPGSHGYFHLLPLTPSFTLRRWRAQSYTGHCQPASPANRCGMISWPSITRGIFGGSARLGGCSIQCVAIRGPGSEAIQLSAITASSREAAPGRPVSLSVDITGQNIGYIYLFAGYF